MLTTHTRPVSGRWIVIVAVVVFLAYASQFLYFFVDDEAIPLVYAQNLVHGRGLIYSSFEGPVEGYSDFLHVIVDAGLLASLRAAHAPKLAVVLVGKIISLLAGVGTIVVAFLMMRRFRGTSTAAVVAGLSVLALAGPFAVWSTSSLETVPFTLLVTLVAYALYAGSQEVQPRPWDRLAVVAGALAVLERLDGVLFVGVLVAVFILAAPPMRRRVLMARIGLPLAGFVVVYHGWRLWHFGDLLNTPLHTKVMYKLRPNAQRVVKAPEVSYARRFALSLGWPGVVAGLVAAYAAWRDRSARTLCAAVVVFSLYVAIVGDWMFGFRFFVALYPLAAVVVSFGVATMFARRRGLAWVAAAATLVWCGTSAYAFERTYEATERKANWLHHPSLAPAALFGTYYETYQLARKYIRPGDLMAYNQAGFVPFMLEVENIDDLGICSRYYAELPSEDVFFTEVGRYTPFTSKASVGAEEAYLLYRDVPFVIQRRDLLRKANEGHTPTELMGGYYALLAAASEDGDAIYRRTDRDRREFQHDPRLFSENLAHVACIRRVTMNGAEVPSDRILDTLPALREDKAIIPIADRFTLDVQFGERDLDVMQVDINQIRATGPVDVSLDLYGEGALPVRHIALALQPDVAQAVFERLPDGTKARRFRLEAAPSDGRPARMFITDLRVNGQRPELAAYVRKHLPFPRP